MKHDLSFIIYSHSSYSDVWAPFFDRTQKHINHEFADYFLFVDDVPDEKKEIVPEHFQVVKYADEQTYPERLLTCLTQVKTKCFLFQHEDMILFDDVNEDVFQDYVSLMHTQDIDFIKLLKGGAPQDTLADVPHEDCPSLRHTPKNAQYMVAIQPSLWNKNSFVTLLENHRKLNIWEFESQVQSFCREQGYNCFYSFAGTERKRGLFHWDSDIYPAICTAIFKGKWTMTEYHKELNEIFETYTVDKTIRGTC
tara:strand:- start:2517 stop:3272 length:756 start_codon:yes stop_codon:yes gene_type:complete